MGKQGASAHCPETLRGSNANTPESPRVFVLFAAKGTSFPQENSVSKAPPCDKRSGEAKCVRASVENTPGEQSASAHCPKTRRESKVRPHIARKHAGEAKCVCALPKNTPGQPCAHAQSPKTSGGSNAQVREAREFSTGKLVSKAPPCDKRSGKAKCARTLVENAPWKPWARFSVLGLDGERDDDEVNAIQKWGG